MKTNIRIVLSSVAILAIASSCSKVVEMSNPEEVNQKVTICASIPEDGMETKALLSQPDGVKSAIKVAWESTDQITVNGNVFTVESITNGGKTALFSGNNPGAAPYTISFSGFDSVNEQTQSQDASLDHLRYAASIAGADSYSNMSFSSAWASVHGATLTVSSVLELRAKLPDAIAPEVQKVIFTFPEEISTGNKRIVVNLDTKGVQSADKILDVYATLPAGNINLPNILVQFQVSNNAYEKYSAYREFDPSTVIVGGTTQYLGLDCSNIESYANASSTNIGESTNPYLIGDKFQLDYLHDALKAGAITYVTLVDDIDLNNEAWAPLNSDSPFTKAVYFEGANHTIFNMTSGPSGNYPSFFGVLNGNCNNVSFANATVSASSSRCGIVAGYCGTGNIEGHVSRVHVQGSVTNNGSKYGTGGIFGYLANGTADACSADVTVTSTLNNTGGIFGYCGKTAVVRNCWTSGVITGNQRVGGIGGGTDGADNDADQGIRILNCFSVAKVRGAFAIGGIGGFFNKAQTTKGSPASNTPGNHIEQCIAWNEEIIASWNQNSGTHTITPGDKSHYSDGAIIGYTAIKNYLSSCYRNPAMVYDNAIFFDYTDAFSLYDQENASPSSPLVITAVAGAEHNYPYHGKAAAAGKTLSEVAQSLGWDDTIWDFSTDLPTLK